MKRQRYEIRVAGHLTADWSNWFEGLTVRQEPSGETVLSGLLDQAALHGVLSKIRDLGLVLISIDLWCNSRIDYIWRSKGTNCAVQPPHMAGNAYCATSLMNQERRTT